MTTHTPGPWDTEIIDSRRTGIVPMTRSHRIAVVQDSRPDAALIAAAPELLAALKDASRYLDMAFDAEGDIFGVHHNNAVDAMLAAQAAIAKAEGR